MRTARDNWSEWAASLRVRGLDGLAAWLLEAAGPLTLIAAQLLYFGRPFIPGDRSLAVARLLEDHDETQAFAEFLRKDVDA